jgi:hypothetical protein
MDKLNTREKALAIALGLTTMSSITLWFSSKGWFRQARTYKVDNIILLGNIVKILNSMDHTGIPEELLTDIKFRAMALQMEFESLDDDEEGEDG